MTAQPAPVSLTERRRFGRTGLMVSPLGFGGAPIGFLETEQDTITRVLNLLLDRGVNLIDTAAMYRGSEESIGRALAHRRDEFVLVSKCGTKLADIDAPEWSPALITATVDRALRLLRTDHLDVMLLHSCDVSVLRRGEALGALVRAREAGKVLFAGYSGDHLAAAEAAALPDIAVIQTSVNMCDQRNIDIVLPVAMRQDVGVMAKRPVANAAWKPLASQQGIYTNYAAEYTRRFGQMSVTPAELGFAADPASAWAEIALRFTLSIPGVHTAIVGTTAPAHVEANLRSAAQGPLPTAAVERLRAAFLRADPAGEWTGQT